MNCVNQSAINLLQNVPLCQDCKFLSGILLIENLWARSAPTELPASPPSLAVLPLAQSLVAAPAYSQDIFSSVFALRDALGNVSALKKKNPWFFLGCSWSSSQHGHKWREEQSCGNVCWEQMIPVLWKALAHKIQFTLNSFCCNY